MEKIALMVDFGASDGAHATSLEDFLLGGFHSVETVERLSNLAVGETIVTDLGITVTRIEKV